MSKPKSNRTQSRNLQRSTGTATGKSLPAAAVRSTSLTVSQSYSGPVPPPEILAAYNEIVPGSAEQIINQFVAQGRHRMAMEDVVIKGDVRRANYGLAAGFVLAAGTIAGSFYMTYLGKEIVGIGGLLLSLGSLATAFIYGTVSRRRERVEKEKLRPDA